MKESKISLELIIFQYLIVLYVKPQTERKMEKNIQSIFHVIITSKSLDFQREYYYFV